MWGRREVLSKNQHAPRILHISDESTPGSTPGSMQSSVNSVNAGLFHDLDELGLVDEPVRVLGTGSA